MARASLDQLLGLRKWLLRTRIRWLRAIGGIDTDLTIQPSMSSRFRAGRRGSIMIGSETLVAFKTLIYSRDPFTGEDRPVRIGSRCFVGAGSMILPGVTIGDECIVGAGSVVFDDVPARSIVGGNPARILRRDIEVGPFGRLSTADATARRLRGMAEPDRG
jgi:maltose O-acetyltransferase